MKYSGEVMPTSTMERRKDYFEHGRRTNGANFLQYRHEVMTEEEEARGQKIVENFREAYEAKERAGVFRDMEIAESYWSGEFANKTPDMPNVNFINANIETQVADLMDQNIDIEPRPYDPSDAAYVPRVRQIGNKIIEVNRMPKVMQKLARGFKTYGHGWLRVLFNPELLEGLGCPEIAYVSSAEIYPDPAIKKIEDINKGRFFIQAYTATIHWAEQTFGMKKASAIYPGHKPYSQNLVFSNTIDTSEENYLHILYWMIEEDEETHKKKLRLIQCSGCGVILKDSNDFEKDKGIAVFPDTKEVRYPYWAVCDMEREDSIWGKSNASLLYSLQDVADEIDAAILSNGRQVGNPKKLVTTASGIDPELIDNTEGQVIVSNTSDGIRNVDPPNMPNWLLNRRAEIMNTERMIVSRVSDQQSGQKQHGVDTATESLALQQNALKAIDATKTILQLVLADVFMYAIELAIEYWTDGMFFEGEKEGEFDYFNPSELNSIPMLQPASQEFIKAFKTMHPDAEEPKYMESVNKSGKTKTRKLHVILNVSVGAGIPKNKAFMYNAIKEQFTMGAMDLEEYREKLEEYLGIPFDKDAYEQKMMAQQGQPSEEAEVPLTQSQDVFATGGANPQALDRLNQQGGKM